MKRFILFLVFLISVSRPALAITPVFSCGFECGVAASVSGSATHWGALGTGATIQTTTKRTGDRALRVNVSAQNSQTVLNALLTNATWVMRFYVRFDTLPDRDTSIWWEQSSDSLAIGLRFKQSDSKLYCFTGSQSTPTLGTNGVSVTTGQWYRIDLKLVIVGSSGTDTIDAKVDGTDLSQGAANVMDVAAFSPTFGAYAGSGSTITADIYFDDVLASFTSADYPLGDGHILGFVPASDGTHNVSSTNFQVGTTGTPVGGTISVGDTIRFQWVNGRPILGGATDNTRLINQQTAASTQYVEVGIEQTTESNAPKAVEVLVADRQAATQTCNFQIKVNDNGTEDAVVNRGTVAGITTDTFSRKHYAIMPADSAAWTLTRFKALKFRFGYSSDATPDVYWRGAMVEAEFADTGGPTPTPTPVRRLLLQNVGAEASIDFYLPLLLLTGLVFAVVLVSRRNDRSRSH